MIQRRGGVWIAMPMNALQEHHQQRVIEKGGHMENDMLHDDLEMVLQTLKAKGFDVARISYDWTVSGLHNALAYDFEDENIDTIGISLYCIENMYLEAETRLARGEYDCTLDEMVTLWHALRSKVKKAEAVADRTGYTQLMSQQTA